MYPNLDYEKFQNGKLKITKTCITCRLKKRKPLLDNFPVPPPVDDLQREDAISRLQYLGSAEVPAESTDDLQREDVLSKRLDLMNMSMPSYEHESGTVADMHALKEYPYPELHNQKHSTSNQRPPPWQQEDVSNQKHSTSNQRPPQWQQEDVYEQPQNVYAPFPWRQEDVEDTLYDKQLMLYL
jgi:hypothetical protein